VKQDKMKLALFTFVILSDTISRALSFPSSLGTVTSSTIKRKDSPVLPGNVLPSFLFMQGGAEGGFIGLPLGGGRGSPQPYQPDDSCSDDIFTNDNPDLRSPQLPYLTQDQWGCQHDPTDLDAFFLEDDYLQVRITPAFAGKVWGITDKVNKREMLFDNPAHQPANIADLRAWASGGCEWNYSPGIIGHSAFTETPSWVGVIETPRGPIVRVYDFDRYNHTTWSVDMFIANGIFWAHPRLTNNNPVDLQAYWWTCVAHHVTPESRVLTPATRVVQTTGGTSQCNDWPKFTSGFRNDSFTGLNGSYGVDNSYLGNIEPPGDFFVRIPQPIRPYIAHVEADGYTVMHGHPLNGTKFFTWGQNGPGRFMQDFLAGFPGDRSGDYTELQIGPAPTQMNTFPLPGMTDYEWTEWFSAFQADVNKVHSADYNVAVGETDSRYLSDATIADMNAFFATYADTDPTVVQTGTDWGGLEELRRKSRLRKGLVFNVSSTSVDAAPWVELVTMGQFSTQTLSRLPTSYMVHDDWLALLQSSQQESYLRNLHIAINLMERGDVVQPLTLLKDSLQMQGGNHPVTLRCIGLLQSNPTDAAGYLWQAWNLTLSPKFAHDPTQPRLVLNLGTEMFSLFLQNSDWASCAQLLSVSPANLLASDLALIAQASVLLYAQNNPSGAISILQENCFPTIASARPVLENMWLQAVVMRQTIIANRTLTPAEARNTRIKYPVPRNIGCTYGASFCSNYW